MSKRSNFRFPLQLRGIPDMRKRQPDAFAIIVRNRSAKSKRRTEVRIEVR